MSILKTDTIVGAGGNNEVTFVNNKFTGSASGNITLPGEGGTVTTNLQQGLAKCWVNVTGTSTTVAKDSFNVSGLTDTATGRTQVAINNNMANDDFAVGASSRADGCVDNSDNKTTGNFELMSIDNGGSTTDSATKSGIVAGDLA